MNTGFYSWLLNMSADAYKDNPEDMLEGAMKVLWCPSTRDPVGDTDSLYPLGTVENRWKYHVKDFQAEGSYALNEWVGGWTYDGPQGQVAYRSITEKETSYSYRESMPGKANIPVFFDSIWMGTLPRDTDIEPKDKYRGMGWADGVGRLFIDRHNDGVNMTFADGHIEGVKLDSLWSFKWHKVFKTRRTASTTP